MVITCVSLLNDGILGIRKKKLLNLMFHVINDVSEQTISKLCYTNVKKCETKFAKNNFRIHNFFLI